MALLQRRDRKLTPEEKEYARRFLAAAQADLTHSIEVDPPTYKPPNFLAIFRHNCEARAHKESTALQLREVYVDSMAPINTDPATALMETPIWRGHEVEAASFALTNPGHVNGLDELDAPLPVFGFIYREGQCGKCKDTARSPAGRLVLQSERPAAYGRMARD